MKNTAKIWQPWWRYWAFKEPFSILARMITWFSWLELWLTAVSECRTSPYQDVVTDGAHLTRSTELVEQAYANTGLPVYLGGHSNGPLYALALLHSKSAEWRSKYIGSYLRIPGLGIYWKVAACIHSIESMPEGCYVCSQAEYHART